MNINSVLRLTGMGIHRGCFRRCVWGFVWSFTCLSVAYAQADYATGPESFTGDRAYKQAMLAPDGNHFAVLTRQEDKTGVLIYNIDTMQVVAGMATKSNQEILRFWWANNERVVLNLALRGEYSDYPLLTGELYALNIDNTRKFAVAGFGAGDSADYRFLDVYPADENQVRVIRSDIRNKRSETLDLSRPTAYTLDIYKRYRQSTGTNMKSLRLDNKYTSPYPAGGFVADNAGQLRLAYDIQDGQLLLSERNYTSDEWVELPVNARIDSAKLLASDALDQSPIVGFDSLNEGIFYLALSEFNTVALYYLDIKSGVSKPLYVDDQIDLARNDLIVAFDREVVGVYANGAAKGVIFNKRHAEAGKLNGLFNAFKGNRVEVINYSKNGEYALVDVISDGNESGLYLFDTQSNSVSVLMPANK